MVTYEDCGGTQHGITRSTRARPTARAPSSVCVHVAHAAFHSLRFLGGWFYEGGGIYRKTYLHSAPPVHVDTDGVTVYGNVTGAIESRTPHALGQIAASASVVVAATLVNTGPTAQTATVRFDVIDADGTVVGTFTPRPVSLAGADSKSEPTTASTERVAITVASAELWSIGRPYLYELPPTFLFTVYNSLTQVCVVVK